MKSNKTLILALGALILIALGYYAYAASQKDKATNVIPGSEQKLDISTICQGALTYTTFPDAAAAELYVQECKEGKHPDVIERYKEQMNLGDGAAI
jgi:hypothetical protein